MAHARIVLIHALQQSVVPARDAFRRGWADAEVVDLLDTSLSVDLQTAGGFTRSLHQRFQALGRYAVEIGADGILFTCSAFGPCIDEVKAELDPLPVLAPYDAMIAEATEMGGRIGLLATFEPTLHTLPEDFPPRVSVTPKPVPGALTALTDDPARHDELAARAAAEIADSCDVIALAQFSLARAAPLVAQRTGLRVLTSPDTAVAALRRALEGNSRP